MTNDLQQLAQRFGVSIEAVSTLQQALQRGGGTMAQFNHPELGGMGQWQQGGMVMVGDMFNNALKAKVDGLCVELSKMTAAPAAPAQGFGMSFNSFSFSSNLAWWSNIADVQGQTPNSAGSQNSTEYAYFRDVKRLLLRENGNGAIAVYDTLQHVITGVSQAQQNGGGKGAQSLVFQSQLGQFGVDSLKRIA
ncbi:MAG: hypothetical protein EAZ92_01265 [Candidatus Kapaibacterium sp.]|nr:MAG: hypothetical protein EAZ92_01265 [Candidatus Kapabacteria bacterium]